MMDIPTGIMITAIMIMATVKMNDNFLIARYTPFLFCYIVTASPEAPREKRLGEPFGSDLYKKAPNDCNCLHSMSALVAITGHDSIVKRRDSPFSFRYLCFLLEESIRKQKVPERKSLRHCENSDNCYCRWAISDTNIDIIAEASAKCKMFDEFTSLCFNDDSV